MCTACLIFHPTDMTAAERIHAFGSRQFIYPYRFYVLDHDGEGEAQLIISVPKKIFRRAVRRNLVRRRTREAVRHLAAGSPELRKKDILMVYVANEVLEYGKIVECLGQALDKILCAPA